MQREGTYQDFTVIKKLGEGSFGQVHMVKRKADNQLYALKKVRLTGLKEKEKNNALNEIRILASIEDDYIIQFKEAFFESATTNLFIVMEYADGGDLMKMIETHVAKRKRIPEEEIWKALIHITRGLKSLHHKKILHRDIKAANVFISKGIYKLGDMNVSKVLKKELAYTQTGTPYYASPQVWQDLPYDRKSDMWSLGCVMYEMATLQAPFKAKDLQSLFKKVMVGKYKPLSSIYSEQLTEVISMLLQVNPKNRPDASDLLNNHTIRSRCELEMENSSLNNINHNSLLLETIRFNPLNPSLKGTLPRATYEKQHRRSSLRQRTHKDSLENESLAQSVRALSSCRRRESRRSTEVLRKYQENVEIRKQAEKHLPPIPKYGMHLPLIGKNKIPDQNSDRQMNRMHRAGREVLCRRIF